MQPVHSVAVAYDYGDRIVDFRDHGFDGTINMDFPAHLAMPLPALIRAFDAELATGAFPGRATLNYLASHDDMASYDQPSVKHLESAEALLLAPGGAQIYYGDEIARSLVIPGTKGDANLRSDSIGRRPILTPAEPCFGIGRSSGNSASGIQR